MRYKIILILLGVLVILGFYLNSRDTVVTPVSQNENEVIKPDTLEPQSGLPAVVEAKRQAIYAAAQTRDYAKLAAVAEPEGNFHYSFGGAFEGGFAAYMEFADQDENRNAFDTITILLKQPYALVEGSLSGDIYVWPSVFTVEPSKWTEEDMRIMKTLLTDEQIAQYKEFGGYAYYRLGITADGKWIYYLAGD